MEEFRLKPYLIRLYIAGFFLFVVNKFVLRPVVLDRSFPRIFEIIVLSLPNTIEVVLGVTTLAGIFTALKFRFRPRYDHMSNVAIVSAATIVGAVYVLTQEFKIHNLGGRNVYDPYDVVASVIGLVGMFVLLSRYGVADARHEART